MRLQLLVLTLSIHYASLASADFGPPWIGFRPVREIPDLRWTMGSIFEIYQPEGDLERVIDMTRVKKVPYPDDGKHIIQLVQFGTCNLQKIRFCPIFSASKSGTAFLFRDQNTLVTVLHNLQTWVYFAKKFNPKLNVDQLSLPTFVLDADGNVIVNPLDSQQHIRMAVRNPSVGLFSRRYSEFKSADERRYISASEYIELSVSPAIPARPLQPAKNDEGPVLAVGFPEETNVYSRAGGGDSKGKDLYASMIRSDTSPLPPDWPGFEVKGPMVPGNSGSPIFNSEAQVIGVAIAGQCEIKVGDCPVKDGLPDVTAAALTVNTDRLRTAWKLISDQPGTPLP